MYIYYLFLTDGYEKNFIPELSPHRSQIFLLRFFYERTII